MASLRDTINTTLLRRNGQLVETATPTSQLAGQAGMLSPPTTPAGVAAIGGTPQQQNMAGSANQKQSALRQSLDTTNTLQEAQADKRYRSAMTAEEQATQEKQKKLSSLFGDTQGKVQNLISNEISKLSASAAAPQPTLAVPSGLAPKSGTTGTQDQVNAAYSSLTSALASGKSSTDPEVQGYINQLTALTGQNADKIASAASDSVASQVQAGAGAAAAGQLANNVGVSQLLPQLGTTREELADLLGISPEQIDSMNIQDLDAAVSAVANQGSQPSTSETEAESQNPLLGAAERAAMRERSRELSTSGVAASEAQLEDLGRSLASADTIQFGGKQWTTEQLLSDENISQLVSDYLTNPNSEASKALAADPAAKPLMDFINRYKDVLTNAAKSVGAATTENKRIQTANASLQNIGNIKIPDAIMQKVYGDKWGTAQTGELGQQGLVKTLNEVATNPKLEEPITRMLTDIANDPKLYDSVANLDATNLTRLLTPGADGTTPFQKMRDAQNLEKQVGELLDSNNIDKLLSLYFGTPGTTKANLDSITLPHLKELGLSYDQIMANAGARKDAKGHYPNDPSLYNKGLATTLANAITSQTMQQDTPQEVISGNSGWTPKSLTGILSTQENEKQQRINATATREAQQKAAAAAAEEKRKADEARVAAQAKREQEYKQAVTQAYVQIYGIGGRPTQRTDMLGREIVDAKTAQKDRQYAQAQANLKQKYGIT